jgi:hypothetical protein
MRCGSIARSLLADGAGALLCDGPMGCLQAADRITRPLDTVAISTTAGLSDYSKVQIWPTPSVATTRPARNLSGDKLPSAENVHDGRR